MKGCHNLKSGGRQGAIKSKSNNLRVGSEIVERGFLTIFTIIIIITRPKLAYNQQGLAGGIMGPGYSKRVYLFFSGGGGGSNALEYLRPKPS